jgi:hypothetical protein
VYTGTFSVYCLLRKRGSSERGRCSRWKRSLIEGCGGAEAMERLTASLRRGEYWATCFSVLAIMVSICVVAHLAGALYVLLGDAVERLVIVETKVTSVDDVVRPRVCGKLVERLEVACICQRSARRWQRLGSAPRTSATHRTLALPCCITRPWLGSSGTAPGTGPEGVAPLGR